MKTTIFVPKQINVGFQNRSDTYTKKLAYIIYFDQKGVLRKEKSWNSWRDEKIPNMIYDNTPTSGFVLNKNVGDYDSGWNHRHAYCRVYDPRGFEFEISIENLLYILENTSSIKGKGLEGEFVYGWDGTELVLIPVDSPDYKEISKLNEIRHSGNKFKGEDLIVGATYLSDSNNNLIYLGKFYKSNGINKESKVYFFYNESSCYSKITYFNNLNNNIIELVDDKCCSNYAKLMDELIKSGYYSDRDPKKDKYEYYNSFEEFQNSVESSYWGIPFFIEDKRKYNLRKTYRWHSYNKESYYDVYYKESGKSKDRVETEVGLKYIYDKYKPKYLITYKSNGELIKEWKKL